MEQWYTLHTKPNAEYRVMATLQRRAIETYLPEILTCPRPKEKRKQPFFHCYLFAKIDLEQVGFSAMQWTPGLLRIVAFDEQPAALPDEVIELIRAKVESLTAAGGLPRHNLKPGDTVRIKEGPFQNMLAVFDGPITPAERVQVLLEILGYARRVKVAVADLEKTNAQIPPAAPKRPRRTRGRGRRITTASKIDNCQLSINTFSPL